MSPCIIHYLHLPRLMLVTHIFLVILLFSLRIQTASQFCTSQSQSQGKLLLLWLPAGLSVHGCSLRFSAAKRTLIEGTSPYIHPHRHTFTRYTYAHKAHSTYGLWSTAAHKHSHPHILTHYTHTLSLVHNTTCTTSLCNYSCNFIIQKCSKSLCGIFFFFYVFSQIYSKY